MKRILLLGSLSGAVAAVVYGLTLFIELLPSQQIAGRSDAGLQWLRHELRLSDQQVATIARLQEAYRPSCQEMCRQILAADSKLKELLRENHSITPEIQTAIAERDRLRSDCRQTLLQHVYAVSGELSSKQRQRYLTLVSDELLGLDSTP